MTYIRTPDTVKSRQGWQWQEPGVISASGGDVEVSCPTTGSVACRDRVDRADDLRGGRDRWCARRSGRAECARAVLQPVRRPLGAEEPAASGGAGLADAGLPPNRPEGGRSAGSGGDPLAREVEQPHGVRGVR